MEVINVKLYSLVGGIRLLKHVPVNTSNHSSMKSARKQIFIESVQSPNPTSHPGIYSITTESLFLWCTHSISKELNQIVTQIYSYPWKISTVKG